MSCGFKSHLPHETKGSTRMSWSFYFVRKGTLTQQLRCVGSGIHTRLGRTSSSVHPWLALGSKIPRQVLCSKSHLVNCCTLSTAQKTTNGFIKPTNLKLIVVRMTRIMNLHDHEYNNRRRFYENNRNEN